MTNLHYLKKLASSVSVLYVEDNEEIRNAFADYIKMFFTQVTVCTNGYEGLKAYEEHPYDIVITDINMPRLDGLSMSKEIKKIRQDQHIIIVSAYKNLDNYIEAIKIGVDGYILKPIEYDQVNSILFKLALQISYARENEEYKKHLEELVEKKTQQLKHHYITDQLTGLFNKAHLTDTIEQESGISTLLLLNIDNFSIINHNLGFAVGDLFLQEVAKLLYAFEQSGFALFRLYGDEFVFFKTGKHIEEAQELANSIKQYFNTHSVKYDGFKLNITFSYAIDASDSRELMKSTSLALQEVRQNGKNLIGVYSPDSEFEKQQRNNLKWIEQMKICMKEDALVTLFQPIKNLHTNEIRKYEVLSRFRSKDGTIIPPLEFLNALTLGGMITEFTKKVIHKAFEKLSGTEYIISLNITTEDLKENYLVSYLEQKRKEFNLHSSQIILEVLESISTINEADLLEQFSELKRLGYKIAIDDFGTEHSNFSRLLTFKADFIKIDGSFIKDIVTDTNAKEIAKAITSFAHNVGSKVIAEYVWNEEVYEEVQKLGIDFVQGYYIREPQENF